MCIERFPEYNNISILETFFGLYTFFWYTLYNIPELKGLSIEATTILY